MPLCEIPAPRVEQWCYRRHPHPDHSTLPEILQWPADPESRVFFCGHRKCGPWKPVGIRVFVRAPQIFGRYCRSFSRHTESMEALGLGSTFIENYFNYAIEPLPHRSKTGNDSGRGRDRWHEPFAASVKMIFTPGGERGIPVACKSLIKVSLTTTGKIRLQKGTVRKSPLDFSVAPEKGVMRARMTVGTGMARILAFAGRTAEA